MQILQNSMYRIKVKKMKKVFGIFYKNSVMAIAMVLVVSAYSHAAVVSRPTAANNAAAARAQNRMTARTPTMTTQPTATTATPTATEPEPESAPEQIIKVDNKSSMFTSVMDEFSASSGTDRSEQQRAEMIQHQIELYNMSSNNSNSSNTYSAPACNDALRGCMAEKCGDDFTKCANDSTTIWAQKMSACRAKTQCTAHEYNLIAPEIMADRDTNVRTKEYRYIKQCGTDYNKCIFNQCGDMMENCLAKKDEDNAISKCESFARTCREQDSGLAARAREVFGDLRIIATDQAKRDEAYLYELRKKMGDTCARFGAVFDERTLDCVYTVNFFAGEDRTLMASKKLFSDKSFQCTPDWFGIDITTFKENAYRLTRAQTSASAGALGGGIGMVAGMASSGGLTRALDTYNSQINTNKAEKQLKNLTNPGGGNNNSSKPVNTANDGNSSNNNLIPALESKSPTSSSSNSELAQTTLTETIDNSRLTAPLQGFHKGMNLVDCTTQAINQDLVDDRNQAEEFCKQWYVTSESDILRRSRI